ncbi:winged helix-turn-helix transcriptional regulator [Actinokineospora spheciospongiae]|uniref:winged helix-turn-helix transcriptional regulator n=1 Tax=Actinokineospora spheciospongiae TaxID=909613 RepID=UPI0005520E7D|nr:helix-turn-helix domain-containing protein [Actinokineospora spheciospongiae]
MTRYRQHCPVAAAAEVLNDSWTLLILRDLAEGRASRSDLAAGLPGITPALLTKRLGELTKAGLVVKAAARGGSRFALTEAGRDLVPVIDRLGRWANRHLPPPRVSDLDPGLLARDLCRGVDTAALPALPLVVHIRFTESAAPPRWWLMLSRDGAAATQVDPGLPAAVRIDCAIGALAGVWLGHRTWGEAVRDQAIRLTGTREAVRAVIGCLGVSRYASRDAPPVRTG